MEVSYQYLECSRVITGYYPSFVLIKVLSCDVSVQALYIQNLSNAIKNPQVSELINLLKCKNIWCLNIGENYEVSTDMWEYFCNSLPDTSVTHLYVSEHVIPLDLKNKMRQHIRENRKKHTLHCSLRNIEVIEKCTNMWWYVR
jgi:hypothetical protein